MVATIEIDGGAWALLVLTTVSFSAGVALSPMAIFVARTLDIVDKPNGKLKRHAESVAYLGGLALCLASILALAFIGQNPVDLLGKGVAAGALALLVLGTIDDKLGLSARFKLMVQLLICPLVAYTLIGDVAVTSWFWVVAASAWLVLMTNAFNILDVANGLAASVAATAAAFIALLGFYAGNIAVALAGTALVGAAFAFLLFNFPRARMFLGSAHEGFPLTVLEAMAAGVPVVATRVDGCIEIIKETRAGVLIERGDTEGGAAAVVRLLDDRGRREQMGRRARKGVARWNFDSMCEKYKEVYWEVCYADC